ncbi:MAG TPA: pyridoxal phosphate-dependent aminotransferase [Thermodesulfovibrionales bacterium]|nr:pyridoxal phosphate-dependent aminotransferase [Thermodesulfovibrionales bacterium]
MKLSKRVSLIKPSPTLALEALAKAMKKDGIDVVSFSAGEPDFDTPDGIKNAAISAINDGFTKYTPSSGIIELRNSVAEKLAKHNGLSYKPEEILISCGAKHSLYNLSMALFEEGDEVIIPSPYWVTYPEQILLCGAKPVIAGTSEDEGFLLKPEILERLITEKTRGLILNSPSNPVGSAYDRKHLEKIAEIAVRHNIYVISDEIYEGIVYDGFKHISIASLNRDIFKLTIVINGVSKSYAMTGWRIGYAAGPQDIIEAMGNIQSQSTSNPTSIAQKAALEALSGRYEDFISSMVERFDKRRHYIVNRLRGIPGVSCFMPVGSFYVFPNISGILGRKFNNSVLDSSVKLAEYFLNEAKVAAVPGDAFGAPGFMRLSFATSMDNIEKGLDRLESAIKQLV